MIITMHKREKRIFESRKTPKKTSKKQSGVIASSAGGGISFSVIASLPACGNMPFPHYHTDHLMLALCPEYG